MSRQAVKAPENHSAPNLSRHASKCRVCNHPDRAAIEFDFLNWRNPSEMVTSYRLSNLSTIYRHAHATGLFARRRLNLRFALERIVERVSEVPVTASAVIRAARAVARINDAGEWIDPPTRLIITRADSPEPSPAERAAPSRVTAESKPRPAPIFEPALLEEPSASAAAAAEQSEGQREAGRDFPATVILALEPELATAVRTRRRQIEESRQGAAFSPGRNRAAAAPNAPETSADSSPAGGPEPSRREANRAKHRSAPSSGGDEILIANETHSRGESSDGKHSRLRFPDRK